MTMAATARTAPRATSVVARVRASTQPAAAASHAGGPSRAGVIGSRGPLVAIALPYSCRPRTVQGPARQATDRRGTSSFGPPAGALGVGPSHHVSTSVSGAPVPDGAP